MIQYVPLERLDFSFSTFGKISNHNMTKLTPTLFLSILIISCSPAKMIDFQEKTFAKTITDERDNISYGIVEVGDHIWFAENLKYKTPKSLCFNKKEANCQKLGRLYPYDELDIACPEGWRVPNIKDYELLKASFEGDSIRALLDTVNWVNPHQHTNQSGISLQGVGYQVGKRQFLGNGRGTSLWLNQFNKFDEYYHVHFYGGNGAFFEKSNYRTNEVFHAHPIEDIENRKLSIRCVCNKKEYD